MRGRRGGTGQQPYPDGNEQDGDHTLHNDKVYRVGMSLQAPQGWRSIEQVVVGNRDNRLWAIALTSGVAYTGSAIISVVLVGGLFSCHEDNLDSVYHS